MAKYTKKQLVEMVAGNINEAEIFYEAANNARTRTELCKLNLIETANKVTCAVMWLDKLHNKYTEEFNNAYDFEKELKAMPEVTHEEVRKARNMIAAVNCIIKYNENYFKEEGYL